jgi:hypothetical protein
MSFVILKQLLPAIEGDENFNYIDKCSCIDNDEIFLYNTVQEAEEKITQLINDSRYIGRKFKIIER